MKKMIDHSDIVVHMESFSEYYANFNDNYFSTKIADCLKCGRPFVAYAPSKIAFAQYLEKDDAVIVTTEQGMLSNIVKKVVIDPEFRLSKITDEINSANKNHNGERNIQMFQDILIRG